MKTVCFYYTQSGQALDVAQSICKPLGKGDDAKGCANNVVFKQIVPQQHYPFPWSKDEFLNCFPESRLGMPPSGIEPIDFSDVEDADAVIIVGQSWYLSPSLPIQSFFKDENVKRFLCNREVVFVNSCRNMWLMTLAEIKKYLKESGSRLVGHIVLQDETPNLISVLTIIRWLMYGKKEASMMLPRAGVSIEDVRKADRFGNVILRCFSEKKTTELQDALLAEGAVHYKPTVMFVEKVGHRMFGFWSKFVRKKGEFGDPRRRTRLNVFFAYLLTALFVVSPFGILFFYLTYPLRHVKQDREKACRLTD